MLRFSKTVLLVVVIFPSFPTCFEYVRDKETAGTGELVYDERYAAFCVHEEVRRRLSARKPSVVVRRKKGRRVDMPLQTHFEGKFVLLADERLKAGLHF